MYTPLKSYQIIISLLKQNNIRNLVLSAGTRNIPFVQSVENDSFFNCYSVVDERSAAYMALGIALKLNEPVVISCTSSTATCNYYPAIAEAFHLGAQLIVLTSDRNPALLGQNEDQMINQVNMYGTFVRKSVNLPIVNTEEDSWYCARLVNEAIIATHHYGKGPVQINIPMLSYYSWCTEKECVTAKKIDCISIDYHTRKWLSYVDRLNKVKRIMIICGQSNYTSSELNIVLSKFVNAYKTVLFAEYMANIECKEAVNPFLPFETRLMSLDAFQKYKPDLVITFGGNIVSGIKSLLRSVAGTFEHWSIDEGGRIIDTFKSLTTVFECSPEYFFQYFVCAIDSSSYRDVKYSKMVNDYCDSIVVPELEYSNNSIIRDFSKKLPSNALLHLSINNSIRLVNFFGLPYRSIKVFANIGTHGIDGCLSSFIGQAIATYAINSKVLSFLVIGDLSFFYDMGAMRIKHIPPSVRILLINNFGGGEFHYSTTLNVDPTLDLHTSAAHNTTAQGWVESVGFKYLSAENDTEYQNALKLFFDGSINQPMLLEAFSEMEKDASITHYVEECNRLESNKDKLKRVVKDTLGYNIIYKVKKILGYNKF